MKNGDLSVVQTAKAQLPTKYGIFTMIVYKSPDDKEHIALIKGKLTDPEIVRIHSSCVTGDIFYSLKCDCGEQLAKSMSYIQQKGHGAILYLNQEGRDIGLTNKIKAYALQEKGYDTVEANEALGVPIDARSYEIAAKILADLGISKIRLLTNNPDKEQQLIQFGIEVIEKISLEIMPNAINKKYLAVKKKKLAHKLSYV